MNVVIIGGVAGGMSCAARLRRLDEAAKITVVEKGPFVSYANCGLPYALSEVINDEAKLHVKSEDVIRSWYNVYIRTHCEAKSIDRNRKVVKIHALETETEEELKYDKLVLAMGSEPVIQARWFQKGCPNMFHLRTLEDLKSVNQFITGDVKNVAVVGGGFLGLEAAENLKIRGLDVTILEYAQHVFGPVDHGLATMLHTELERNGVKLITNARIKEYKQPTFEADKARIKERAFFTLEDGTKVQSDLIIVATGIAPCKALADHAGLKCSRGVIVNARMQTSDPEIYAVGDMIETFNIITEQNAQLALGGPANRQGRLAADHISGRDDDREYWKGHVGTAVCKVFNLTVGIVGLSPTQLQISTPDFNYVTIHPPHHAGYYPGANSITLRVSFDTSTTRTRGRILGAQAIGKSGVDKRIDVIATAIMGGMNIRDLEHLELGYAPPYGSAKDPINMAGFVAMNVFAGDVKIVHAEDIASVAGFSSPQPTIDLNDYQILDVRSVQEYEKGHLPNAINIPIGQLRERIGELEKKKKTISYCFVGYRGYLGYRILMQNGFESVANLDGGFKMLIDGGYQF
jgi:NADPH-dependent 2,4-dienoyl-CoA reductase/sulfur reductase-like enzyme/rhodanese-related sulfurtransferase